MPTRIVIFSLTLFSLIACHRGKGLYSTLEFKDSALICFDNIEMPDTDIITDTLRTKIIPDQLECKGIIIASPNGIKTVSTPYPGIIRNLNLTPGEVITKGTLIAEIENPEFIKLQEEYLNYKSDYRYLKEDYKRQGELNLENATSMKVMQKAQQEFEQAETSMLSLQKQLQLLGINPDSLNYKNLQPVIKVFASGTGIVSDINVNPGMFCKPENAICKITDNQHPMIQIHSSVQMIGRIKVGQKIEFTIPTNGGKIYDALISGIIPDNTDKMTLTIFARILNKDENLNVGQPVSGYILTGSRPVYLIAKDAVITMDNKTFLFSRTSDKCLKLTQVNIINTAGKELEITGINEELKQTAFIVSGVQQITKKLESVNSAK